MALADALEYIYRNNPVIKQAADELVAAKKDQQQHATKMESCR